MAIKNMHCIVVTREYGYACAEVALGLGETVDDVLNAVRCVDAERLIGNVHNPEWHPGSLRSWSATPECFQYRGAQVLARR